MGQSYQLEIQSIENFDYPLFLPPRIGLLITSIKFMYGLF